MRALCDSRRWGISRLFKKFTVRKIVPGNFHRRRELCGNDVAYDFARRDASRDRIVVAGILTNDGRGCGSREKFQSLLGSREYWVTKNLVANG